MLSVIRERGEEVLLSVTVCRAAVSEAFQHLKILDRETGDQTLIAFVIAELEGNPSWMAGAAALEQQI